MKCPQCGAVNAEDRKFCRTCGFVLAWNKDVADARPKAEDEPGTGSRIPGRVKRPGNRVKQAAVAGAVVIVVILLAFFLYGWMHADDADLRATVDFEFVYATPTTDAQVHVWGDVYNWGHKTGSGVLTIHISDAAGNTVTGTIDVGPVDPQQSFPVDATYVWPYPIIGDAAQPVAIEYSI